MNEGASWAQSLTTEIRKRFPEARFAFNYSSSFNWFNEPEAMTFAELGAMGVGFIFITLGGQHANGHGLSTLLSAMADRQEQGYIELQRKEWDPSADIPTRSHHQFSGVPYHHLVGKAYDAARLGTEDIAAEGDSGECNAVVVVVAGPVAADK